MIHNDLQLEATQQRILYFERLLAQFRVSVRPAQFPLMSGGYRAEIEKMHKEAMDYLGRHASQPASTEKAGKELAQI